MALLCLLLISAKTGLSTVDLPDPDLTGTEPQVAAKIRGLRTEVQHNPDSGEAWGKLAMNLDVHDFKKESIPCYKQAIERAPKEFKWPYYCAMTLYEMGSAEALPLFAHSCALKPKYGPARFRFGQALLEAGRLEEASRELHLAAKNSPEASHPHLGLARISVIEGRYQEAITNLLEAIRRNPKHGEAHALLADVYRRENRLIEANREQLLAQHLPTKTPPDDPLLFDLLKEGVSSYWYELRGRAFLQQGAYDAAITELRLAVKALPDARLYDLFGIALQYAKRYKEAAEQHSLALALQPKSAGTMNNLAAAWVQLGRLEEAARVVEKAIQTEPDFSYSYVQLSSIYLGSRKKAEAISMLRQGHERLPANVTISLRLSWLLSTATEDALRNGMEALHLAQTVCKQTDCTDAESLDVLAAAYAETGSFNNAVEFAGKAYRQAESDNNMEFVDRIKKHLKKYEVNKPYRE